MKSSENNKGHIRTILSRFLPTPCSASVSVTRSSTLPPEIIIQVLECLVAELNLHAQALFFSLLSGYWTHFLAPFSDSKGEAYLGLHHASVLNRTWYSIGVELLYRHVVLTSSQDILLFRRTIDSSPRLASLVHEVTFAGLEQRTYQRTVPQGRGYRKHLKFVKGSLTNILTNCLSIDTLNVNIKWPIIYDEGQALVNSGSQTPFSIRKLVACDHTLLPTLAHFTFPLLEVLCLDGYGFRYSFTYPKFPNVHTLQLYDASSHWHEHVFGEGGLHRALPSLRNLEVYNHSADITPVLNSLVFSHPSSVSLQRVSILETPSIRHLDTCGHWGNQIHTTDITLGVISYSDVSIASLVLPPSLHSFTLVVEIPRGASRVFVFKNIHRCLVLNAQNSKLRSLERFAILLTPDNSGANEVSSYESHLDLIRDFCGTQGIQFTFDHVGMSRRHLMLPVFI